MTVITKGILLMIVATSYSTAHTCDGFARQLMDQHIPEGDNNATFVCHYPNVENGVGWLINGSGTNQIDPFPMDISIGFTVMSNGSRVEMMTIRAFREYNGTVVGCLATLSEDKVCLKNATLWIIAPPAPVDHLCLNPTQTKLSVAWVYSLITVNYTIQFCIDVCRVVGEVKTLVHTECGINESSYVFSVREREPDPSILFEFLVTPRYNIDGARNGTPRSISGYFIAEPSTLSQDSMSVGVVISQDLLVTLIITFCKAESWITGGRKVDEFLVEVVLSFRQVYKCSPGQPVVTTNSTLSLDANCSGLPVQRLGNVIVTTINRVGNSSLTAPLSTHFLQDVRSQPCRSNRCQFEVVYDIVGDPDVVVGSLIMLDSGEDEIHYFLGMRSYNSTRGSVSVSGLMKGHYNLLVFPLNKSGLPSRFPANLQSEVINVSAPANDTGGDHDERPVHLKGFKHTGGRCFQCWFSSSSSASNCAVMVHTLEVMNVFLFQRNVDGAAGCVVVEPSGQYYVVAFAYINNTIHGQPYKAGWILLQGGGGTSTSAVVIVVVILIVVAAVFVPSSAYVGRKCYQKNNARSRDTERAELNQLQAVTSMEELLSCFRDINPDWPAVRDELIALNKHELAGKVYTDYILPKLQENEQADSGRYTLTTSTGSAGVDNGEGDGVPTQDSEGDKFGDPQSEHGRSGVSSVVSHNISDPSKEDLAESDLERAIHKQATDDGSNYDDMLRQQQTLSTIPTEGSHNSIQNERELYPAAAEEGNKSDVIPFINNPTN